MAISTRWHDREATVSADGEVDLATGPALESAILAAIDVPEADSVVVDLTEVGFIDSSGISILLRGRRAADGRGTGYRVVGATGAVLRVLEMTGVWAHLSG